MTREEILTEFRQLFKTSKISKGIALHLSHRHNEHPGDMVQVITATGAAAKPGEVVTRSRPRALKEVSLGKPVPVTWVVRKVA